MRLLNRWLLKPANFELFLPFEDDGEPWAKDEELEVDELEDTGIDEDEELEADELEDKGIDEDGIINIKNLFLSY